MLKRCFGDAIGSDLSLRKVQRDVTTESNISELGCLKDWTAKVQSFLIDVRE
jgi:hypothetical protein